MNDPYFLSIEDDLILDRIPISGVFSRTQERNAILRKFARFMANDPLNYGSTRQFAPDSPLELLNQGRIQSIVYEGVEIPLPNIDSLKKESYVVYDDSSLERDQAVDILKVKSGMYHGIPLDYPMKFNLVTMMLPSIFYFDGRNGSNAVHATRIKIFNYTYLKFNQFHDLSDDAIRQNVRNMIRLNLLTVCYEALRQNKRIPFIINPPGAFIYGLSTEQVRMVAQIISDAVSEIAHDRQADRIAETTISEWILLNPDFWSSRPDISHKTHFVQADVCHIAEELFRTHEVMCPLPMMGEPPGAIGNGALGDGAEKALDEFFFRACGGIHGLLGSLRYNPDICILPLSQIAGEMEKSSLT